MKKLTPTALSFAFIFAVTVLGTLAQASEGNTVLTCTPSAAESNRSGLESIVIKETTVGCPHLPGEASCMMMRLVLTADVVVHVSFDNTITQSYPLSTGFGQVAAGAGEVYKGKGFSLNLGPVTLHQTAHVTAELDERDGLPPMTLRTSVTCK